MPTRAYIHPTISPRVFLLSPARLDGVRARTLLEPRVATRGMAGALRTREGVPIGEVFTYLSGLYFRGKLAYATTFARPPSGDAVGRGAFVITANRGLVPAETRICIEHLEAFAETDIHHAEQRFRAPLVRDAERLRRALGPTGEVVLLGSVAAAKYTAPLLEVFGDELLFPSDFVGRGDMSRGGLLLRCVDAASELGYAKVKGATLRGARPPKLEPRRRGAA